MSPPEIPLAELSAAYKVPPVFKEREQVAELLRQIIVGQPDTSDIIFQPLHPITIRKRGKLYQVGSVARAKDEIVAIAAILSRPSVAVEVQEHDALNVAYDIFTNGQNRSWLDQTRFRVNISQCLDGMQIVLRTIPKVVPSLEQIGISPSLAKDCLPSNGLVLVCGTTGSGKSTTLAALLQHWMALPDPMFRGNFITLEDPIEFPLGKLRSAHSIIAQSEVPSHFKTFASGIREAMRRMPAGMLVGEMRDEETISAAIEMATTGHPVFSTVHAETTSKVIQRCITRFESSQVDKGAYDLLDSGRMIITQRLITLSSGERCAAREILNLTSDVRSELKQTLQQHGVTGLHQQLEHLISQDPSYFPTQAQQLIEQNLICASSSTARLLKER